MTLGQPENTSYPSCVNGDALPRSAPILEWLSLLPNDEVEIYANGALIASGRVDMLAPDASVLWLQHHGPETRRLFLRSEVTVYKRATP